MRRVLIVVLGVLIAGAALVIAMVGSTTTYVLVALSAVALVPWAELAASSAPLAPLALVAGGVLGPRADTALSLVALAASTIVNAILMAG